MPEAMKKMKTSSKKGIMAGIALILAFILWTVLIQVADVQPVGVEQTNIGLARMNTWFHRLTGVHMKIYTVRFPILVDRIIPSSSIVY